MAGFRYQLPGPPVVDNGPFRYREVGRQVRPNIPDHSPGIVGYVKGEPTRFTGEVKVYQTLLEIGWLEEDIEFQMGFAGGRNFVGGIVADFYIHSWPVPTLIFFDGDHWHDGERQWQDIQNDDTLRRMFYGAVNIVHIFGFEAANVETLRNRLLKDVGSGLGGGSHVRAVV